MDSSRIPSILATTGPRFCIMEEPDDDIPITTGILKSLSTEMPTLMDHQSLKYPNLLNVMLDTVQNKNSDEDNN